MYIGKALRLLGISIASLAVSANGNSLSLSFALGEQKFTAKTTDKEEVVGVHSAEFRFEENINDVNGAVQDLE